jgi:hypothetical protein
VSPHPKIARTLLANHCSALDQCRQIAAEAAHVIAETWKEDAFRVVESDVRAAMGGLEHDPVPQFGRLHPPLQNWQSKSTITIYNRRPSFTPSSPCGQIAHRRHRSGTRSATRVSALEHFEEEDRTDTAPLVPLSPAKIPESIASVMPPTNPEEAAGFKAALDRLVGSGDFRQSLKQ